MKPETIAVKSGAEIDPATGAVAQAICLSTTFEHAPDNSKIYEGGHGYIRDGNPNVNRLEAALAKLDRGADALVFSSGMAAASAYLQSLPSGSHVIFHNDLYYELRRVAQRLFPAWGLTSDIVDMTDERALRAAMKPETALLWFESPSNPRLEVIDIAAVAALAHKNGAKICVDGTFATPVLQQPLVLGADVVMHSATKYMGGHSDVQGGALVFAEAGAIYDNVKTIRTMTGGVMAPFNAWLILRGVQSLYCRMNTHCANAQALAEALEGHPKLDAVHYPGLATHKSHLIAKKQMSASGGMLSIEVKGGREAALAVAGKVKIFINATSLGGIESLIEHRASVEGADTMAPAGLLRMSVGLEHCQDLIDDVLQALG